MAFKHTGGNGKSSGVRVKNSYYTFSKEYPAGTVYRKKKPSKKEVAKKRVKLLVICLAFLVLVSGSYFGTTVLLTISKKSINEAEKPQENVSEVAVSSEFRGYNFPSNHLNDTKYINNFIKKMVWNDANVVVIDFKDDDGTTIYPSAYANQRVGLMFDSNTIRKAISKFRSRNILVYVRFSCFRDTLATEMNDNMSIKYTDSAVSWIDDNGNEWLNPYSSDVLNYLEDIIAEILDFEPDGFVLKNVSFPDNGDVNSASYEGETNVSARSSVLESFVSEVKTVTSVPVMVEMSANDVLDEEDTAYYGAFNRFPDGVIVNASQRPDGYELDKETQYISMMSLINSIRNAVTNSYVLEFSGNDIQKPFIRSLKNAGYKKIVT